MSFNLPIPEKLKPVVHYGLIALSVTPPVLAAIGAVYAPAAVWGLAIQNFLGLSFMQGILGGSGIIVQPGIVQGILGGIGAKGLRDSEPKP